MEYHVDGTDIDATELGNGEWETVLRLRKKYRPATADNCVQRPASLIGQLEISGSDGRRTVGESQDGTPTPSRPSPPPAPPRHLRRAPLPQLPRGDFKVVVRPRGGLDVTKQTPRTLLTAISSTTAVSLQEALAQDQLRLHPTNNTFTLSTPVEARARAYAELTSISLGASRTDVTAYLAPPDDAVRCIIHMAYNDEPHREILEGLLPYNPDLPIIDARPFGKKRSLLITLATGPLPKAIRFWAGIHTCFPYRPKVEACYNCRRIGHRQDVCPAPASGRCHNCGDQHVPTEPPTCPPKCIVCGDGHHTGNVECKYRYARRPPHTTQLAAGHQSRSQEKKQPVPQKPSRNASRSTSRDRSLKPKQDLTWADRAQKSPPAPVQQTSNHNNDAELRALREEVSRLKAITQRSLTPPTPSLIPSPPTTQTHANIPPHPPPSKKQRTDPPTPTSGSIDINAKLKNLSDQFDMKLQELESRIESKFNALISDITTKLEARIEQCMETILQRMVCLLETRLTQLPPLATPFPLTEQRADTDPHTSINESLTPLIHPPTLHYGSAGQ
ncbi:hypothetical protein HPB51_024288 [Rhipicephalus microplus]|uniref:CCHC-type domain-containing protein n=1 Tax=Rhipicephalus microplus TaxID=6941 RepID=A0A9J6E3Y8_RHIMP|nr:hypothetical protein HPB51_024288 [Rhipicephalus microplus]